MAGVLRHSLMNRSFVQAEHLLWSHNGSKVSIPFANC